MTATEGAGNYAADFSAGAGWHGLMLRNQRRYRPEDWKVYSDLGADVILVDVIPASPAAKVGIKSGAWVALCNQRTLEAFDAEREPVGTAVVVKYFHPRTGWQHVTLTLTARPKAKRAPRRGNRARIAFVEAGAIVTRTERPRWLGLLCYASFLSPAARLLGTFLVNVAVRNDGWTQQWSLGRLVRDLGISRATVQRSIRELQQAGFLRFSSGRHVRQNNSYAMTWPIQRERGNVFHLPRPTAEPSP
jgi:hypothetical protein